jgi:hypothetical protein
MPLGPLRNSLHKFPETAITGAIATALKERVDTCMIRITKAEFQQAKASLMPPGAIAPYPWSAFFRKTLPMGIA